MHATGEDEVRGGHPKPMKRNQGEEKVIHKISLGRNVWQAKKEMKKSH